MRVFSSTTQGNPWIVNAVFVYFNLFLGLCLLIMGELPYTWALVVPSLWLFKYLETPRPRSTPVAIAPADPQGLNCVVWDIRHTQKNLLEAGVIKETDLTVCENEDCPECSITRKQLRVLQNRLPHAQERKAVHGVYKELVPYKEMILRRPHQVPDFAAVSSVSSGVLSENSYVVVYWQWIDPSTGYSMSLKSMEFHDELEASLASYERNPIKEANSRD